MEIIQLIAQMAIAIAMLTTAAIITVTERVPTAEIPGTQVVRSGMSASVCVMGVTFGHDLGAVIL